jgi:hypothetical protein
MVASVSASISGSASAGAIRTSNDIPGRFSTRLLRWRERGEVFAIACELIRGDLAIANGGQFATQELNWRAILRRRALEVDNCDPRAPFKAGARL